MTQAKLISNVDNGTYSWNDWTIKKQKDSVGSYYRCTDDQQGLWFEARTLKEVRTRLPEVVAAHEQDGTILHGVRKTPERFTQEQKDRPAEQKLAVADRKICEVLTRYIEKAETAYDEFMTALQEAGLAGLLHPIEWKTGPAVESSYLVPRYQALLRHEDPAERKQHIEQVHEDFVRRLTSRQVSASRNDFHGAVDLAKKSADHEFFGMLDSFLRIYRQEYCEAPEPISWI